MSEIGLKVRQSSAAQPKAMRWDQDKAKDGKGKLQSTVNLHYLQSSATGSTSILSVTEQKLNRNQTLEAKAHILNSESIADPIILLMLQPLCPGLYSLLNFSLLPVLKGVC